MLTEKATGLANNQVYMFQVQKNANKFQVKEAVEKLYTVKVASVAIINRVGKVKKVGRRMTPKKLPSRKIAIIKVREGKISLFPQS